MVRQSMKHKLSSSLPIQDVHIVFMLLPVLTWTLKPFKTTNLVVFAPENGSEDHQGADFVAHGDALIVDPECLYKLHVENGHVKLLTTALLCLDQLKKLVDALSGKLIVFVTHHHRDHIGGFFCFSSYSLFMPIIFLLICVPGWWWSSILFSIHEIQLLMSEYCVVPDGWSGKLYPSF